LFVNHINENGFSLFLINFTPTSSEPSHLIYSRWRKNTAFEFAIKHRILE
jgi:hypothetical protein